MRFFQFINLKLMKTLKYRINHLESLKHWWCSDKQAIMLPLLIAINLEPCLFSMLHSSRTKETIWLYWVLCIEFCQKHPERKYKARRISGPIQPMKLLLLEFRIHGDGSAEFVEAQLDWDVYGCIHSIHAVGMYLPLTSRGKAQYCPYEKQPGQMPQRCLEEWYDHAA